jgi:hypothetical protein
MALGSRCRLDNLICFGLVAFGCRRLAIMARCRPPLDTVGSRVSGGRSVAFTQPRVCSERIAENGATLAGNFEVNMIDLLKFPSQETCFRMPERLRSSACNSDGELKESNLKKFQFKM